MKIVDPQGKFALIRPNEPGMDMESFSRAIDLAKTAIDIALQPGASKIDLLAIESELMRHVADRTEALVGEDGA